MAGRRFSIPLSWHLLTRDKLRLLAAVSGIVFAVTLMMTQIGFRDALYIAAVQFHRALNTDLVMVSSRYEYMVATKLFSERQLYRTLAVPGVESVAPLYVSLGNWKNRQNNREAPIYMIGFDPAQSVLKLPGVQTNLDQLKVPDVVLYDLGSRPDYGPIGELYRERGEYSTEVNGHRVQIGGLFTLGLSFGANGNLAMSDTTFRRILPNRPMGLIDIGLIRLRPDADRERVLPTLRRELQPGLLVLTMDELIAREKRYWAERTPIGFIFSLGVLVGFIVGSVIVYQILYTDVTDHLREYATLKAMGYTDRFLQMVVIQEAVLLAIFGFIPGWMISACLGVATRKVTLLPAYMTWERPLIVFLITIVMCTLSGMLAMRKLRSADPADIF